MFTIYKKVISPETSPVLGPANTTPRESPTITPKKDPPPSANMEAFSLCDYCCSARPKQDPMQKQGPMPKQDQDQDQSLKYEFGHATHYTYNATTPRMICEFDFKSNS